MSKKKKRKNKYKSYKKDIDRLDKDMHDTYKYLMKDIKVMHEDLYAEDMKALKRAKKKAKGDKKKERYYYHNDYQRKMRRLEKIRELEGSDLLDRVIYNMDGSSSIIKILSRLVAALILAILSIEGVRLTMSDSTLRKMTKIYEISMNM